MMSAVNPELLHPLASLLVHLTQTAHLALQECLTNSTTNTYACMNCMHTVPIPMKFMVTVKWHCTSNSQIQLKLWTTLLVGYLQQTEGSMPHSIHYGESNAVCLHNSSVVSFTSKLYLSKVLAWNKIRMNFLIESLLNSCILKGTFVNILWTINQYNSIYTICLGFVTYLVTSC